MTPEEIELVKKRYPVSRDVEQLSLGGESSRMNTGLTTAPDGAGPGLAATQGSLIDELKPARPVRQRARRYAGSEGRRAFLQELENANHPGPAGEAAPETDADHETRIAATDGGDHGVFEVSIAFRFQDRRRRDLDGATATLLDCLIHARRRLLDTNPGVENQSGTVRPRRRRRDDNHQKDIGPVPF